MNDTDKRKSALGKIAADLTTIRVQTIVVQGELRTADPPEPAVMLAEIHESYEQYLNSENPDDAVVWRIKQNCALINRIYAKMDARAKMAAEDPAIKDYVDETKKHPAKANGIRRTQLVARGKADQERRGVKSSLFLDLELRAEQRGARHEDPTDAELREAGKRVVAPEAQLRGNKSDWDDGELPTHALASQWGIHPDMLYPNGSTLDAGDIQFRELYRDACRKIFQLEPDELLQLRRIWERGVESIAMETVIELDGDIVTRVSDQRLSESAVREIHIEMVRRAINSWQFLIEAVGQFAASMLEALGSFFVGRG